MFRNLTEPDTVASDWKTSSGGGSRSPSIIPKRAPRHIERVIVTDGKGPKPFPVSIQKLSRNSVVVWVNKLTSIMDVHCWLWKFERIHPDQQRLTWRGKRVDQGCCMGDLGVQKRDTLQLMRVLPGAFVSAIATWEGEIPRQECDLPTLRIEKGSILVAHTLVHMDWLFCTNQDGFRGFVPRTHLAVLEIFKKNLYEELESTSAVECCLPALSQPPIAVRVLRFYPFKRPLWRQLTGWLKSSRVRKGGAERSESVTRIAQRRYLDPWDRSLRLRYLQEAEKYIHAGPASSIGTPTLPPLRLNPAVTGDGVPGSPPPVNAESSHVLRHGMSEDLGGASVVLQVSLCQLTSREDFPMIHASLKCTSYDAERVTSVCISFKPLGDNKVLDLWPRDASGPIRKVSIITRDTTRGKAKASAAIVIDPVHLGADVEQERGKEIEKSFIVETQVSIKGWDEGTKARWDWKDDAEKKGCKPKLRSA